MQVTNNKMIRNTEQAYLENSSWRDGSWQEEWLFLLGDARNLDPLDADDRCEITRGIGRSTDCTKALHAAGALIVAHTEDVKSPVPLKVNEKDVEGKGSVVFAWVLPVAGSMPPGLTEPARAATGQAPGVPANGRGRGPLIPISPEIP
jgi:hypothetical protein